jgi:hypothetical protein
MINMDMVGRLVNKALTVYGTGTSTFWPGMLEKLNADSVFAFKMVADGVGPSDHSQFYAKDIPVLFFFTGTHSDYHKPSDDWDKINYTGEKQIASFVVDVLGHVDGLATRPDFVRTPTTASMSGDSRGFSVTLGVVPDYGESSSGMKIGSTRPGGPAEKAGLKSGDIIVMLAGKRVLNIYDYMGILGELKAGKEVDVEVNRNGSVTKSTVVPEKRR